MQNSTLSSTLCCVSHASTNSRVNTYPKYEGNIWWAKGKNDEVARCTPICFIYHVYMESLATNAIFNCSRIQRQPAVTSYFSSKQLLLFGFKLQCITGYPTPSRSKHTTWSRCCFNVGYHTSGPVQWWYRCSKQEAFTQCCSNVGSAERAVAQH